MTKRVLPILFLLIFLCSCNESAGILPTVRQIEFAAQTVWQDTPYLFSVATDSELNATLTVKEPASIKGLRMTFSTETVKTEYYDLKNELPLSSFDSSSPFSVVYQILSNIDNGKNKPTKEKEYILSDCNISGIEYRIYFSETGLPLKAESPDSLILFKGITILN